MNKNKSIGAGMDENDPNGTGAVVSIISGGVAGTATGVGGGMAVVSAAGTTVGLSGPGIMSGLAAIGGTAVGGVAIIAVGTVVLAAVGAYGGYILYKRFGN